MTFGRHWFPDANRCMSTEFRHCQVVDDSDVARNAHLVHVESFRLYRRFHPEADRDIDQFEHDEPEGSDHHEVGSNADAFGQELRGVAVEQPRYRSRYTVPTIAVGSIGKEAESQATPRSVDTVDRDSADRIIDFHFPFDEERRFDHQDSRDDTDEA